jgi:hypothetical protein
MKFGFDHETETQRPGRKRPAGPGGHTDARDTQNERIGGTERAHERGGAPSLRPFPPPCAPSLCAPSLCDPSLCDLSLCAS